MEDKNEEAELPKKKKVTYKFVNIKKSEVTSKKETLTPNRFQRIVCWMIRVKPAKGYQYMIRVLYSGHTRLLEKDVVINKEGTQFIVVSEKNRFALLLTMPHLTTKPYIHEKLYILPKPKRKIKKIKK